jgi:serine O-acetyltransferase
LFADLARCGNTWLRRVLEVFTNPGMWAVFAYRCRRLIRTRFPRPLRILFCLITIPLQVIVEVMTHIQLSNAVAIGPGLYIPHVGTIVVGTGSSLGANCTICQCVTIGHGGGGKRGSGNPRIGDRVYIGPGAIVIGPIEIGNDVLIGAGSVVVKSVPDRAVVVGNPGRIIAYTGSFDLIDYPGKVVDPARQVSLKHLQDQAIVAS